jgi:hypothetical protein
MVFLRKFIGSLNTPVSLELTKQTVTESSARMNTNALLENGLRPRLPIELDISIDDGQ